MLNNLQQIHFKLLQKESFKNSWTTCGLIGNKIANRITKVSKNSETLTDEHDKEIPKERYVSTEEGQEINDELRLKW